MSALPEKDEQMLHDDAFCESLRGMLLEDAARFALPDSLRSENLLPRLDALETALEQQETAKKKTNNVFYLKMLSAAACMALICFFGWSHYRGDNNLLANGSTAAGGTSSAAAAADTAAPMLMMAASPEEDAPAEESAPAEGEMQQDALPLPAAAPVAETAQPAASDYQEIFDSIYQISRNNGRVMIPSVADGSDEDAPVEDAPAINPATSGGSEYSPRLVSNAASDTAFSSTNTQISDVDEADIVKTDGRYIYHYRFDGNSGSGQIAISAATTLKLLSTIEIEEGYADAELYLYDDMLALVHTLDTKDDPVLAAQLERPISEVIDWTDINSDVIVPDYMRRRETTMTQVVTYDVTSRQSPTEKGRFAQDGRYVSSRMKGDTLYLVTNKRVQPAFYDANEPVQSYFPMTARAGTVSLLPAEDILLPPYQENNNYAVVTALSLKSQQANTKAVLGMADQIMMSSDTLFLTATVPNRAGNRYYDRSTGITAFDVTEQGLRYRADGIAPGYIDNQFSLDEHNGNLRIATTSYNEARDTVNNLFIYDQKLEQIGAVEGLAEGERIYSVRYIGDMAYVVTFRETDPLFAIDCSDPTAPVVKGELKIPGFSEYLHPLDETTLIGVGRNTMTNRYGAVMEDGLKISLFDVSDPENPVESAQLLLGNMGSDSPVLQNHHAFLCDAQRGFFGMPATVYTQRGASMTSPWSGETTLSFAGYLVFRITDDHQLALAGKMEGNDLQDNGTGILRGDAQEAIDRGLYIGDTLYTISNARVMAFSLTDFQKIGELRYSA